MRQLSLLAVVCLTVLVSGAAAPNGSPAWKGRVLSRKYGFSMGSPRGWTAGLDAEDLPVFINFPTSPRVPQQVLPKGGAAISVVARDNLPGRRMREMTMAEWAHFNEQAADRATLVSSALDKTLPLFVVGDPKAADYSDLLVKLVRRIRPA
jgi:hypothetical protein